MKPLCVVVVVFVVREFSTKTKADRTVLVCTLARVEVQLMDPFLVLDSADRLLLMPSGSWLRVLIQYLKADKHVSPNVYVSKACLAVF